MFGVAVHHEAAVTLLIGIAGPCGITPIQLTPSETQPSIGTLNFLSIGWHLDSIYIDKYNYFNKQK